MTDPSRALAVRDDRSTSLPAKIRYAQALADSGLLPAQYRKNPANVLFAYEYAEMLGVAPMAAMNGIHVIEGKPSASSALMSALVRRAGHRLRVTGDDKQAIAEITRKDDPEFTFRAEWTVDRAKQAGLTGKSVWKQYPAAMLKARAITEVARDACEECLMGMHYSPEELGADVDEDGAPLRVVSERVTNQSQSNRYGSRPPSVRKIEPTSETVIDPEPDAPRPAAESPSEPAQPAPDTEQVDDSPASTDAPFDWEAEIERCERKLDQPGIRAIYKRAAKERPNDDNLRMLIEYAGTAIKERLEEQRQAASDATAETDIAEMDAEALARLKTRDELRAEMFARLSKGGISDSTAGREARLRVCSRLPVVNRVPEITSTDQLSDLEMAQIIVALRRYERDGTLAETLAAMSEVSV